MTTPTIGSFQKAHVMSNRQTVACTIEVTSIEEELPHEWVVWGYRQYPHRARIARRTMHPRQYAIPKAWLR